MKVHIEGNSRLTADGYHQTARRPIFRQYGTEPVRPEEGEGAPSTFADDPRIDIDAPPAPDTIDNALWECARGTPWINAREHWTVKLARLCASLHRRTVRPRAIVRT